jgi:multiple antibiotic resistance protein
MSVYLSIKEVFSAFMVLFAVIDILGAIPIIVSLRDKGKNIESGKAAVISFFILVIFLFLGQALLSLFNVDISSFAVAGALILLVLAIEMIFGVEIFKSDGPSQSATLVPLVFPLIAGAASFTTLLSLRAEYGQLNIILAIALNMIVVYLVLRYVHFIERLFGKNGIDIMRKFFGIILLAVSVRLFTANLHSLIGTFNAG